MKPIFLIGYMGSGKTTLGSAVARLAGALFIDLDKEVEKLAGCSVSEIFANGGEEKFRSVERLLLRKLALENQSGPTIIACGGGTPCYADNMAFMNANGTTVLLEADRKTIFRRLKEEQQSRPLIAGKTDEELNEFIGRSLSARKPFYDKASSTFPSDKLENEAEIDETSRQFINQFLKNNE